MFHFIRIIWLGLTFIYVHSRSFTYNLFLFSFLFFSCHSTPTEAECIFHEMLHKWNICNDNKIPCPICNRTFGKNSLRCHLRLHTNERIFKCDHCELKFTRKANLKEHVQRIHLGKFIAKRPSSQLNRLSQKTLLSSRSNEQMFECSICEKKFRKK